MSMMRREPRATGWPVERPSWTDERIDRAFRSMFRDFFAGGAMWDRLAEEAHLLHVEEFVEDGTAVIRAEIPGIDPDKDVRITVQNGMLQIRAERSERKEEQRPEGYHSEFAYGVFRRTFRLPEGAGQNDVKAEYRDGILTVRVPLPQESATPIKVAVSHD